MNLTEEHQEESCVHSNFSCSGTSPTVADVLLYMSVSVVVTMTVCGNLLVIISICHFKQLQTPTNFLLLSLAMADFLVGVIVLPLDFIVWIDPQSCFHRVYCTIFNVSSFNLTCVSIYTIALIAVDRCFALSNPFQYSMKMTVNLTLKIIAILWLSSLIYNITLLYFTENTYVVDMKTNVTCVEYIVMIDEIWTIVDFIIVFVVPFLTIIIMYLKIFAIAKRHANKIRCVRKCQKLNATSMASEAKAAKTLGILVAAFLLCLLPYYVSTYFNIYMSNPILQAASSVSLTILYLNSCMNPVIYALFYPWFQRSFKLTLTFRICFSGSSVLNVLGKET